MGHKLEFDHDAPAVAHAKLDRLWMIREEQGAVTISTIIRDPDTPSIEYCLTATLQRPD